MNLSHFTLFIKYKDPSCGMTSLPIPSFFGRKIIWTLDPQGGPLIYQSFWWFELGWGKLTGYAGVLHLLFSYTMLHYKLQALVSSLETRIHETEKKYEETTKISEERLKKSLEAESKITELKNSVKRFLYFSHMYLQYGILYDYWDYNLGWTSDPSFMIIRALLDILRLSLYFLSAACKRSCLTWNLRIKFYDSRPCCIHLSKAHLNMYQIPEFWNMSHKILQISFSFLLWPFSLFIAFICRP